MSFELRLARQAINDIDEVLAHTLERFGPHKQDEYRELIIGALDEIAANPDHRLAKRRSELHLDARTFHIARRGKRARHFLLYRIVGYQIVEVIRLLHDATDLKQHLPEAFERPE